MEQSTYILSEQDFILQLASNRYNAIAKIKYSFLRLCDPIVPEKEDRVINHQRL